MCSNIILFFELVLDLKTFRFAQAWAGSASD